MAKFNRSVASQGGQLEDLQRLATPELPAGTPEAQPAPQQEAPPAQAGGGLIDQIAAAPLPEAPEVDPAVQQGIQEGTDAIAQGEVDTRFDIDPIFDRARDSARIDKWVPQGDTAAPDTGNGGLWNRSNNLVANVQSGKILPGISVTKNKFENLTPAENAEVIRESQDKEGSLTAAAHSVGAVEFNPQIQKQVPNAQYLTIGSAVVEDMMYQSAFGESDLALDPIAQAQGESQYVPKSSLTEDLVQKQAKDAPIVPKAQNNAQLGKQIQQEYLRQTGQDINTPIPQAEAETLGDAFKEMWASSNPEMVNRITDRAGRGQTGYQLTAEGVAKLTLGNQLRKRMFPKTNVRPSKKALPSGKLPGDVGATQVKKASGKVGQVDFSKTIEDAMKNLATVPNVVDKQRGKILFATVLPVLSGQVNPADPVSGWKATINNVGQDKVDQFNAKAAADARSDAPQGLDPNQMMSELHNKLAQEVRSIAMERNGANYLTYGVQAFNGRIAPQQSFFDPTTSKAVRFVTRNAVPAVAKPGSRIDKNLRQMYALIVLPAALKDADALLPNERDRMLDVHSDKLEAWGDRLAAKVDAITDSQYEAVAQAVEAGKAITDPDFPQIGLDLDPAADADLIKVIADKGEDGPHFIDGVIDYAKYAKAKKAGVPYSSYFNAYIDGKTNGLASNGIQMGEIPTAQLTGVIRSQKQTLLDPGGDIRDRLRDIAIDSIDEGFDGVKDEQVSAINDVARKVYSNRNLNKATTMTFGYGKEIASFSKNIEETIDLLSQTESSTGQPATTLNPDPQQWSQDQKNEYMQWQKTRLKEESTYDGYDPEVLFHSSTQQNLEADSFRYRPVNVPNKGASGKGPGIFTHGYDVDGSKFGGNVYAVIYDKSSPTYSGKEDTSDTAISETFIPQKAVDEITRIWPPGGKVIEQFQNSITPEKGTTGATLNDSLTQLEASGMTRKDIADTLLTKYESALTEVLSKDAIDSRKLMRSSAVLHAAYNEIMQIKSYTGMDLKFGKYETEGYDTAETTSYNIHEDGKRVSRKAAHYKSVETAAAQRKRGDKLVAGDYAYGGSIPGPVQSLDAATVAMSLSGKSWDKLKAKSGGNPYVHTIYDAFKMDANGYDAVLEEVNKNWLEAAMEWNYLEETLKATKAARQKAQDKFKGRQDHDPIPAQEAIYFQQMTTLYEPASGGRPFLKDLAKKIEGSTDLPFASKEFPSAMEAAARLDVELAKHGYDTADPPEVPNVKQYKVFLNFLEKTLESDKRLSQMANKVNHKKKALKKEILKNGHQLPNGEKIALQYYSH